MADRKGVPCSQCGSTLWRRRLRCNGCGALVCGDLPLAEDAPPSLAAVLSALPHLTGDELRRVAEAMPRVAGEWVKEPMWTCWRRWRVEMGSTRRVVDVAIVRRHSNGSEWVATTTEPCEYTTHPTARAAQAACDARLDTVGARLCGEVVRDG
ncbi:MAG: hypothetical protein ACRC4O_03060 [Giesbergeria sp.]